MLARTSTSTRRTLTMSYRFAVHLQAVRDAYSSMSKQYIGMVGDGLQEHPDDMSLVRRHLAGLTGPVLDRRRHAAR